MSDPLISVIVPTWNRAEEVPGAIESILAQTYRPIEVLVIDDGSTDRTPDILASYGDAIRTIRQANAGASCARNTGVHASRGQFVAFLDSDDVWLPGKLETQVRILEEAGPTVCCCLANSEVQAGDRLINFFHNADFRPKYRTGILPRPLDFLLTRFAFLAQASLVRREALLATGGFDPQLVVMEDHDLGMRLGAYGPWAYTVESFVRVSSDAPGSLRDRAKRCPELFWTSCARVYEKLLSGQCDLTDGQQAIVEQRLRDAYMELFLLCIAEKDLDGAERVLAQAGHLGGAPFWGTWQRALNWPSEGLRNATVSILQAERRLRNYLERRSRRFRRAAAVMPLNGRG